MIARLDATEYLFQGEGITASYFPGGGRPADSRQPGDVLYLYRSPYVAGVLVSRTLISSKSKMSARLSQSLLSKANPEGGPITTFTVIVPAVGATGDSPQNFKTKSITGSSMLAGVVFPAGDHV
jgi:hypothetical protein